MREDDQCAARAPIWSLTLHFLTQPARACTIVRLLGLVTCWWWLCPGGALYLEDKAEVPLRERHVEETIADGFIDG